MKDQIDPDALPPGAQVIFGNPYQRGQGSVARPVTSSLPTVAKANKYHAEQTYSELCGRTFASKAEARHGEELRLLEMAGEILNLQYQVPFVLCDKPKITITLDFMYQHRGQLFYEDVKGVLTREFRVKLAWLKEKHGIEVKLITRNNR